MRFHIITSNVVPLQRCHVCDAYTQSTIKFCDMMFKKGHEIIIYGQREFDHSVCHTSYVSIIDSCEYNKLCQITNNYTDPRLLLSSPSKIGGEINQEKTRIGAIFRKGIIDKLCDLNPDDIIAYSWEPYPVNCNNLSFFISDGGGVFRCQNRVFVSQSYMDFISPRDYLYGKAILPWFDTSIYCDSGVPRQNQFLYLARCSHVKGISFFLKLSKQFPDYKFVIAGGSIPPPQNEQNSDFLYIDIENTIKRIDLHEYSNVIYVGVVNEEEKIKHINNSIALIQPTLYQEPCGWNAIESMLCGVPVIAPNIGGFTETVSSVSGILCEHPEWGMYDWYRAIQKVVNLNRKECRDYAVAKFHEERAYNEYMKFIDDIVERHKNPTHEMIEFNKSISK